MKMFRSILTLIFLLGSSVPALADSDLPPPVIKVAVSSESVVVGRPFVLEFILSWEQGPGYQLVPEVTVPEGLDKGPVTAVTDSFGKEAGRLVYKMTFTAREPAEYLFGDLAVRYWLAGKAATPSYEHLDPVSVKAVSPSYLGLPLYGLLLLIGGIILAGVLLTLCLVHRRRGLAAGGTAFDPATDAYNIIESLELAVAGGKGEEALALLVSLFTKLDDQKSVTEYKVLHERAAYGGNMPGMSDLKYFLHLAKTAFDGRYPDFKAGRKEEDNE